MNKRLIYFLVAVLLFVLVGKLMEKETNPKSQELSGALEGMQWMASQRAYPDTKTSDSKYYDAFLKLQAQSNNSLREQVDPWTSLGPLNTAGRILSVVFNPQNPNTIYAGSASGGLWRSYEMGKGLSWEYVPTGFPVLGISSVAIHPQDSMIMMLGTGEVYNHKRAGTGAADRATRGTYGIGILKSTDGGNTWYKTLDWSNEDETGVNEIRFAPSNPDVLYAATTEGTYRSSDGGESWLKVHNIVMATDLAIHPEDEDIVIAGYGNFGSSSKGIYRTTNGGNIWLKAESPIPTNFQGKIQLDICRSEPDYVYASIGNGFGFTDGATWLCRSEDNGITWEIVNTEDYSRWQGWFAHDVAVNPLDPMDLVLIGIDLWKSENGGDSIFQVSSGGLVFGTPDLGVPEGPPNFSHSDHHDVIFHPSDTSIVLYANDGGVNLSEDRGYSFQTVNGGLQTVQFYNGFSVSQMSENTFALGGLQDNSTVIYRGSEAWTRDVGGDGSWTAVNPIDDSEVYASSQYLNVIKSTNQGFNFDQALPIPSDNEWTSFIAPYVLAPSNPQTIYAGRARVYKSTDGGEIFTATNNNNPFNGDPVFCMAVSPLNAAVVIAATAPINTIPRAVFVTTNGGVTWRNVTAGLPDRFPIDVTFDHDSEGTVFITFGGFGSGHVFRSVDYGENWTDISGNLPDVPTSAIVIDPDVPHHYYVGNDLGVFASTDAGLNWEQYNEGIFGSVLVMDLKIKNANRKIYVATHGNGAFERDLLEPSTPVADLETNPLSISLFPNPSSDYINVSFKSDQPGQFGYQIIDLSGRVYLSGNELVKQNKSSISIQALPAGSYILSVSNQAVNSSVPFIKI